MAIKGILLGLLLPVGLVLGGETDPPSSRPAPPQAAALRQDVVARLVVAPTGNAARYRIRERLVGMELPYDAVGNTTADAISGAIALDRNGRVVPAASKVVIRMTGLTSDKERRDGFVQRRLLETEKYPTVELVPTEVRGLPARLPASGTRTFDLVGNLTVKGVTRPTTWKVDARFQGKQVVGTAVTRFTFADFEMEQPKVPVILSLADTIQLEYDFTLQREP